MANYFRVALLVDPSAGYTRGLLQGVTRFLREHPHWRVTHGPFNRGAVDPQSLKDWKGNGILGRFETESLARAVKRTRLPTVDLSSMGLIDGISTVVYDDVKVAELAAEHLKQRNFRNYAFCGDDGLPFSRRRSEAFVRALGSLGRDCRVFSSDAKRGKQEANRWHLDAGSLTTWIKTLPRPIAILAAWDGFGQQILDTCRELNIAVPEEISVLGVDDDTLLCELADPPLSSVRLNADGAGYLAAQILDDLMAGRKTGVRTELIEPIGVATRRSTDVQAISDLVVAAAVRFIREHLSEPIQVPDVADAVHLSRRALEDRFRAALQRTPHDQIVLTKTDQVKRLLAETELPLALIAERVGFDHVETMIAVFKRTFSITPGRYRDEVRKPRNSVPKDPIIRQKEKLP